MAKQIIFRNKNRQIGRDPLDALAIQIRNIALNSMKEYAEEVSKEMYNSYKTAIDWFYADYTPKTNFKVSQFINGKKYMVKKTYRRKKRLYYGASTHPYNLEKHRKSVFKEINNGYGIRVTMEINPKYIEESPIGGYGGKPEDNRTSWVFWRSYSQIIHGFTPDENYDWQYIIGTKYNHINRDGDPSGWKRKTTVPIGKSGGSFEHKLAGTNKTSTKSNLDWMVKEGVSSLKKMMLKGGRFDEIFNKNMLKAGVYRK